MKSGLDAHTSVPPPPPLGGFMHPYHCLNDFGFQERDVFPMVMQLVVMESRMEVSSLILD